MRTPILIIGTLDTKGAEIAYVRERIEALGVPAMVMDSGILGEPLEIAPDVPHDQVALAAGSTLEAARTAGSRGAAVEIMERGVAAMTERLYQEGKISGVICLGGAEGAVMGAAAMDRLPVGVPKLLVTPLASGFRPFNLFIGTKDVMVMHSVVDILGLNPISRAVYDNAAAAIAGMAATAHPVTGPTVAPPEPETGRHRERLVAVTMLGTTTPCVMALAPLLERAGHRPVVFHANGTGGRAMEEFVEQGLFDAVIDLTLNEITGHVVGGFHDGGARRLEVAGPMGIPQVVVPGSIDFLVEGPRARLPERWRDRAQYFHNPQFTLVRISAEESARLGEIIGRKLNRAAGPVSVLWPRRGLSIPNRAGGEFYDPEADGQFLAALRRTLRPGIPLVEVDSHINDPAFAGAVAQTFEALLGATASHKGDHDAR